MHFNKLGLSKTTEIADDLLRIYRKNNCNLFFVRIDRLHFAKMKFMSFIFDLDNPAVSPVHHQMDILRNMMALNFCNCISTPLVKDFWKYFIAGDMNGIAYLLSVLKNDVLNSKVTDDRSKELMLDMIEYAKQNPTKLFWKATKEDSPNAHALIMLTNAINTHYNDEHVVVKKFYHDRQNQFQSSLMDQFQYTKNMQKTNTREGFILDVNRVENFNCELTIADSKANCGLQMVDMYLGLTKQAVDNGKTYHGSLAKLHKHCTKQASISQYTYQDLATLVLEMNSQFPLPSPDQLEDGIKLTQEIENERKIKMMQAATEKR